MSTLTARSLDPIALIGGTLAFRLPADVKPEALRASPRGSAALAGQWGFPSAYKLCRLKAAGLQGRQPMVGLKPGPALQLLEELTPVGPLPPHGRQKKRPVRPSSMTRPSLPGRSCRNRSVTVFEGADARGSPLLLTVHRGQLVQHLRLVAVQPAHDRGQYVHVVAQYADFAENALQLRSDEFGGDEAVF